MMYADSCKVIRRDSVATWQVYGLQTEQCSLVFDMQKLSRDWSRNAGAKHA